MADAGGGYKFQVIPASVSYLGSTLQAEGHGLAGLRGLARSGTGSPGVDAALGALQDELSRRIGALSAAVGGFGFAVTAAGESYLVADTPSPGNVQA